MFSIVFHVIVRIPPKEMTSMFYVPIFKGKQIKMRALNVNLNIL